jgi:hypothetical protein
VDLYIHSIPSVEIMAAKTSVQPYQATEAHGLRDVEVRERRNCKRTVLSTEKRLTSTMPELYVSNKNLEEMITFRKEGLYPSSGEGRGTPTVLGPLERANLNH